MTPSSAKAKGRGLQQLVRDKVIATFPWLTERDVKSTSMGAGGEDVQLSSEAHRVFPYTVECKARETFKTLYANFYQTKAKTGHNLLVVKMNRKNALAVIELDHFFELLREVQNGRV